MKYAFFKILFIYFRARGREGERDGEKHQCVTASHMSPTGDLACNPGMCPDWESNWWSFSLQAGTQSTEPHQPGLKYFFKNIFVCICVWRLIYQPNVIVDITVIFHSDNFWVLFLQTHYEWPFTHGGTWLTRVPTVQHFSLIAGWPAVLLSPLLCFPGPPRWLQLTTHPPTSWLPWRQRGSAWARPQLTSVMPFLLVILHHMAFKGLSVKLVNSHTSIKDRQQAEKRKTKEVWVICKQLLVTS